MQKSDFSKAFGFILLLVGTLLAGEYDVKVDLTKKRIISNVAELDRRAWFGVYHEVGYGEWQVIEGKNIDEWIYELGDMLPSRGTVRFDSYWQPGGNVLYEEDPARPGQGYIDPDQFLEHGPPTDRYVYAANHHPEHLTILSGSGHGQWPDFMCWPSSMTHGVNTVKYYGAHAEAVTLVFENLEIAGALIPAWYEVTNESSIQNNWGWHWDAGAWDSLAIMHNHVADSMAKYWPEVKVSGPTDAYPFRDGKDGSFDQWKSTNKRFIELTGDKLGAYGFHTYEQDVWESRGIATQYEAQYADKAEIWTKGRLEAFVDLWQNEQFIKWGDTKPIVISEYGMLGLANGDSWRDPILSGRKFYSYCSSVNGMLVALLDRPDVIDKMSVFIMSQAPYNLDNGLVFARSDDGGSTYQLTRFTDYLRFWKDLNGEWLYSKENNFNVLSRAFLEDEKTLRIVLHNNYKDAVTVDLSLVLPAGATVVSKEQKTLYLDGDDFVFDDYATFDDLSAVTIPTETTAIVKIELADLSERVATHETNTYADKVLVDIKANQAHEFQLEIPQVAQYIASGVMHLSLYHLTGFDANPSDISVNGTSLQNVPDITHSKGVARCWKQFEIEIPNGLLKHGGNTVSVTMPKAGGKITGVRVASIQSDDATLAVAENAIEPVHSFRLLPNYPNPFNPQTTIEFEIPEAANVALSIFNAIGQRVRTLENSRFEAGAYQVKWHGRNDAGSRVSSGIYVYVLKAGTQRIQQKMAFVQ